MGMICGWMDGSPPETARCFVKRGLLGLGEIVAQEVDVLVLAAA